MALAGALGSQAKAKAFRPSWAGTAISTLVMGQDSGNVHKLLSDSENIKCLLKYVGATERFAWQGEG